MDGMVIIENFEGSPRLSYRIMSIFNLISNTMKNDEYMPVLKFKYFVSCSVYR